MPDQLQPEAWTPSKPVKLDKHKYGNPQDFLKPGPSEDEQRAALFGGLSMNPVGIAKSLAGVGAKALAKTAVPAAEDAAKAGSAILHNIERELAPVRANAKPVFNSIRPQVSPTGLHKWNLPGSPYSIMWAGPGARLRLIEDVPGGINTSIDHPVANGMYNTPAEAQAAVDAFHTIPREVPATEYPPNSPYSGVSPGYREAPPAQMPPGPDARSSGMIATPSFQAMPRYPYSNAIAPIGAGAAAAGAAADEKWKPSPPTPY